MKEPQMKEPQAAGRRSDSEPQMSSQQIDPWMEQAPKSELSAEEARESAQTRKADPIDSQQPPLNYVPTQAGEAQASEPAQVEQEWQPPELSNKKLDKTRDLPHAREFDH